MKIREFAHDFAGRILDCKTVLIFAYSPRFTDFFTDFEKKKLFCSLEES